MQETLLRHGYTYNNPIGRGGFGSCHLVTSMKYKQQFVCKVLNNSNINGDNAISFHREVSALNDLDHPNIIQIYDVFQESGLMFIILEYCPGGTLKDLLDQYHGVKGPILYDYTKQIVQALKYVHSKGYAHNDIKPANIFITSHGKVKLADFGLTEKSVYDTCKFTGSFDYMAPFGHLASHCIRLHLVSCLLELQIFPSLCMK